MSSRSTPCRSCPDPRPVGQLVTQGALPLALGLALIVNPRVVLRPSLVLVLLTLLALTAAHGQHPQRVRAGLHLPGLPDAWASSRSSGCSRRGGAGTTCCCCAVTGGASGRSWRPCLLGAIGGAGAGLLVRGPAGRRDLADPGDPGGPLRGDPLRHLGRPLDVPRHHRAARRSSPVLTGAVLVDAHPHRPARDGGRPGHRRCEPLPRPRARAAYLRARALPGWCWPAVFASELTTWLLRGQTTAGGRPAHRPHQGVDPGLRDAAAPHARDLRGRTRPTSPSTGCRSTATGSRRSGTRAGSVSSSRRRSCWSCCSWRPPASAARSGPQPSSSSSTASSPPSPRPALATPSPYVLDLVLAASLLAPEARGRLS